MYTAPPSLPQRNVDLARELVRELGAIALETREPSPNSVLLKVLAAAPSKLYDGLLAIADGTNWNPGHGAGAYVYQGGAWNPLYAFTPAYTAATLLNAWADYDAANWGAAGYYRDPFGRVHLRGIIKLGIVTVTAFTLPAGFRPAVNLLFPNLYYTGAGTETAGRIDVYPSGNVVPIVGSSAAAGWNTLNGIHFAAGA